MSRLPTPTPGSLGKYSTADADRTRHIALNKSVSKHGYKSTVLDLNLRATLNKNQAPAASKTMRDDIDYLRNKYRGSKSRKTQSIKPRKSRKSRSGAGTRKSKKSTPRTRKSKKSTPWG